MRAPGFSWSNRIPSPGDQGIPRVFTGRHTENFETVRRCRRHILHAVNGEIDLPAQEGIFDFFDEQPLTADFANGTSRILSPRFGCASV